MTANWAREGCLLCVCVWGGGGGQKCVCCARCAARGSRQEVGGDVTCTVRVRTAGTEDSATDMESLRDSDTP